VLDFSIISPTCAGVALYKRFNSGVDEHFIDFTNPLISTLFLSDEQFIKFCENYDYYIGLTPIFGKGTDGKIQERLRDTGKGYYGGGQYVLIMLDDIEIHCIHEPLGSEALVLRKWKGRIKNGEGLRRFFIMAESDFLTLHGEDERRSLVDRFLRLPGYSIFLTQRAAEEGGGNDYFCKFMPKWEGRSQFERDNIFALKWNNHDEIADALKLIIDSVRV